MLRSIITKKRLSLSAVLLAVILVAGCDTFSDFVPGIQAVRLELSDTKAVMTDVRTEVGAVKDGLEELIAHGDTVDREVAAKMVERFDKVEGTIAKVEGVVTGVEETLAATEEEAAKRAEEEIDWASVASEGAELAGYFGVPGMGVVSLILNRLRRRANATTESVVRGVEVARDGNGGVNWDQLSAIHERAGVSDVVHAIRKKHKAEAEAAVADAGGAVKTT